MKGRRADLLTHWDSDESWNNGYAQNRVVYYVDKFEVGKAYRAKVLIPSQTTRTPPDEDKDRWEYDKSYAAPWKSNGKYESGSLVYYFNGQSAYIYVASIRYFGGNQPPNEEVDDDGIRTWELNFDYDTRYTPEYTPLPNSYGFINSLRRLNHLVPVKTECTVEELVPYNRDTMEYLLPLQANDTFSAEEYNGRNLFFNDKVYGRLSSLIIPVDGAGEVRYTYEHPPVLLNSVHESHPYDSKVYNFYEAEFLSGTGEDFLANQGKHLKKGVHHAQAVKEKRYPQDLEIKRQNIYTRISEEVVGYYSPFGFSIDIWPNFSTDKYSWVHYGACERMVTVESYNFDTDQYSYGTPELRFDTQTNTVNYALSIVNLQSYWRVSGGWFAYQAGNYIGYVFGPIGAPNVEPSTPTSETFNKIPIYVNRHFPYFDGNVITVYITARIESYSYKYIPAVYGQNPDGSTYVISPEGYETIITNDVQKVSINLTNREQDYVTGDFLPEPVYEPFIGDMRTKDRRCIGFFDANGYAQAQKRAYFWITGFKINK